MSQFSPRRGRRRGSITLSSPGTRRQRFGQGRGRAAKSAFIDPQRFVNQAVAEAEAVPFTPVHAFTDFRIDDRLKQAVVARGYIHPTPVQDGAIPHVLQGKDLIGIANTGTGKTAAFLIPIIHAHLTGRPGPALIVVPTRELATQINEEFRAFTERLRLYSVVCVGAMNMNKQIQALRRGPQVVIGTPGRLKDLLQQGELKLGRVSTFVLDEADRMMDMGFINDIRFLISHLPTQRQSLCFSATITPEITGLLHGVLRDPVTISVRTRETSDHVEQDVVRYATRDQKLEQLHALLISEGFEKVLVFGDTKHGVQRLADKLEKRGFTTAAIHGNKSQPQRQRALDAFKKDQVRILVATDVAARGLDIPEVTHVINYDTPKSYDDYIHRIGRTGRAGNSGKALTFVPAHA